MRKFMLISVTILLLAIVSAGVLSLTRAQEAASVAIRVNGEHAVRSNDVRDSVSRVVKEPHAQAIEASAATDVCLEAVPGTRSFVNEPHGYCLLLPAEYSIGQPNPNEIAVYIGSPLDVEHPKVFIAVQEASGRTAGQAADEIISGFPGFEIQRYFNFEIDGEAAVVLDGVPGQDLSRQVIFAHQERIYRLTFLPADKSRIEIYNQLRQLYKTVTASFRFLSK